MALIERLRMAGRRIISEVLLKPQVEANIRYCLWQRVKGRDEASFSFFLFRFGGSYQFVTLHHEVSSPVFFHTNFFFFAKLEAF